MGFRATPVADWSAGTLARAHAVCQRLLAGVGTGETRIDAEGRALHHRRSLSDKEIAMLNPNWLALPAVDEA
jgi:hypothetical protein